MLRKYLTIIALLAVALPAFGTSQKLIGRVDSTIVRANDGAGVFHFASGTSVSFDDGASIVTNTVFASGTSAIVRGELWVAGTKIDGGSPSALDASDGDPAGVLSADASGNISLSSSVTFSHGGSPSVQSDIAPYDAIVDAAGYGDYTSIQSAIDDENMRIFVRAGTYSESVTINQPDMWVEGAGPRTVVDGASSGIAITVAAKNVHLSNIAAKTTGGSYDGIHFTADADSSHAWNITVDGADGECYWIEGGANATWHRNLRLFDCGPGGFVDNLGHNFTQLSQLHVDGYSAGGYSGFHASAGNSIYRSVVVVGTPAASNPWTCSSSTQTFIGHRVSIGGTTGQIDVSCSNSILEAFQIAGTSTTNHIAFSGDNNYMSAIDQTGSGTISIIFNSGANYNLFNGTIDMGVTDSGTGNNHTDKTQW